MITELTKAKEAAGRIPAIVDRMRSHSQVLRTELSDIDKRLNLIAHSVEAPMDAIRSAKFMAEFARLRRRRRDIKQEMLVTRVAIENSEAPFREFPAEVKLQQDRNRGINAMARIGADNLFKEITDNDD
jgi:hypothetical protein